MKPEQNNSNIADIIELSHAMLRHAEAGEWESVAEHEPSRRRLLDAFFSTSRDFSAEPGIRGAIQELIQLNDRLESLSVSARDEAKSALTSLNKGRTAVNAYMQNSG